MRIADKYSNLNKILLFNRVLYRLIRLNVINYFCAIRMSGGRVVSADDAVENR